MTVRKGRIKAELNSKRKRHDQGPLGAPSTGSIGLELRRMVEIRNFFLAFGKLLESSFPRALGLGVFSRNARFGRAMFKIHVLRSKTKKKKNMMGDGGGERIR